MEQFFHVYIMVLLNVWELNNKLLKNNSSNTIQKEIFLKIQSFLLNIDLYVIICIRLQVKLCLLTLSKTATDHYFHMPL